MIVNFHPIRQNRKQTFFVVVKTTLVMNNSHLSQSQIIVLPHSTSFQLHLCSIFRDFFSFHAQFILQTKKDPNVVESVNYSLELAPTNLVVETFSFSFSFSFFVETFFSVLLVETYFKFENAFR
jgi:hypothetical protein